MVQYWFPWVDVYQLISIPKKKNQIVAHANAPLNTSHEPESQSHVKTPNKTSNASNPKMSMLMLLKGRRRKQLIPINLKWMMLPSASQGANGIPTTSNIDIILQKIADRMMKGSI